MKQLVTWLCILLMTLPGLLMLPGVRSDDKILDPAWGTSTNNTMVHNGISPDYNPQLAPDGSGGAIIVWEKSESSGFNLYAQRVDANGTMVWASVTTICDAVSTQAGPKIISDGAGGAIITWLDYRNGGRWDIYAQRVDSTGSVKWTKNGMSICTLNFNKTVPCILSDGLSGAYIFWSDKRNGNFDVFGQRLDNSGNIKWPANGTGICIAPLDQMAPRAAPNGQGGCFVTWVDNRNGNNDIYGQCVSPSGILGWTLTGQAICTATGAQDNPKIILSTSGYGICAWTDFRYGLGYDIFAQSFNTSGYLEWGLNGKAICTATQTQDHVNLVPDNNGGAIITWDDLRSGMEDIYAQKVDRNGNEKWTPNGTSICNAMNSQKYPEIISDRKGGAVIVWQDNRDTTTSTDVYAQHVTSDSSTIWGDNGIAVCNHTLSQQYPKIADDQKGDAIVTWYDVRGTDEDIYAQMLFVDIDILTKTPPTKINQSQVYYYDFDARGAYVNWALSTNSKWLSINESTGELKGIPINQDVGTWWANVSIKGKGIFLNYTITVNNVNDAPIITKPNPDVLTATEDVLYLVQYIANDIDKPGDTITWSVATNATFLSIGPSTGVLSGTPDNSQVGPHPVNVSVSDGKGGVASHLFTLTVNNVNDPPVINTTDITTCNEDVLYRVAYAGYDPDPTRDVLTWELWTNASFLSFVQDNSTLIGTPNNEDVGSCWVNVSVNDGNGARAFHNFSLTIKNANDAPQWTNIPENSTLQDFESLSFDVNASDADAGDAVTYTVSSIPSSSIAIDKNTGVMAWKPGATGKYAVLLTATDGIATIYHTFSIDVVHTNYLPVANLTSPKSGSKVMITNPTLTWESSDKDGDPMTFALYLGEDYDAVYGQSDATLIAQALNGTNYSGIHNLTQGSTYYWTVIPYDGKNFGHCHSGVWNFSISSVAVANSPPEFTSSPTLQAWVGVEWNYLPEASDLDREDKVFIDLVSGPDGMGFVGAFLKWTPTSVQLGPQNVVLRATDNKAEITQEFTINVEAKPPENLAPKISKISDVDAAAGDQVRLKVDAKDPENSTLYYSVLEGPDGANISSDGWFQWFVPKGSKGPYHVVIEVSDGVKNSTVEFDVIVKEEGTTSFAYWWVILAIALLIVIVVVIIIIVIMKRRSRPKEEPVQEHPAEVVDAEIIEPVKTKGQAYQAAPIAAPAQPMVQDMQPVRMWSQAPDGEPEVAPESKFATPAKPVPIDNPYETPTISSEKKGPALNKPVLMLPPAMVLDIDEGGMLNVDEVFLLTNDGLLLNHYVGRKSTQIDEDILSGMITAVQNFVRDSFKSRSDLKMLRLGDYNIMIEKGKLVTAVVMTTMDDPKSLTDQLRSLIQEMEDAEGKRLKDWNGDVSVMDVLNDYISRFMKGEYGA